jgi:hypothetical protein
MGNDGDVGLLAVADFRPDFRGGVKTNHRALPDFSTGGETV